MTKEHPTSDETTTESVKRRTLTVTDVDEDLYQMLDAAAHDNDRSLAGEMRARLRQSFQIHTNA